MPSRAPHPKPSASKAAGDPVRYAAFLRGVSPMNAKMPELAKAFVSAGFERVATVLASGNVVFSAAPASEADLEHAAEAALQKRLGRAFATIVRSVEGIDRILAGDPYEPFSVAPEAKRVVTFLRARPKTRPALPIERDGARILRLDGQTVYSAYVPSPLGPVFMSLLEKTFGREITTRTWDTLRRVSAAAAR
jgi:uncharacterized protein (DUF1697 family)